MVFEIFEISKIVIIFSRVNFDFVLRKSAHDSIPINNSFLWTYRLEKDIVCSLKCSMIEYLIFIDAYLCLRFFVYDSIDNRCFGRFEQFEKKSSY